MTAKQSSEQGTSDTPSDLGEDFPRGTAGMLAKAAVLAVYIIPLGIICWLARGCIRDLS